MSVSIGNTIKIGDVFGYKNDNSKATVIGFDLKGIPVLDAEDGQIYRYSPDRWKRYFEVTKYAFVITSGLTVTMSEKLYNTYDEAYDAFRNRNAVENSINEYLEIITVEWKKCI